MTARFILEEIEAKVEACEGEERARVLHDVLRPNVDERMSTRASQKSVDDLSNLLTSMLDELKVLISSRADRSRSRPATAGASPRRLRHDAMRRHDACG